jgi:hypothetical protein
LWTVLLSVGLTGCFDIDALVQSWDGGGDLAMPGPCAGQNLIVNSGFEANLDGWSQVESSAVRVTDQKFSGSASAKICYAPAAPTAASWSLYTSIVPDPGASYCASAWVSSPDWPAQLELTALIDTPVGGVRGAPSTKNPFWQQITSHVTAGPGTKTVVVEVISATGTAPPTAGLCFWVDDVVLTKEP